MLRFFTLILLLIPASAQAAATDSCLAVASVNGMVCDFCVQSISKTLKKDPAVDTVKIDLTAKTVTIGVKPGQTFSDEAIGKVIHYAGYDLTGVKRVCEKP